MAQASAAAQPLPYEAQGRSEPSESQPGPWQREADAFVRAFSGAFLFAIPLLFTMEMWWLGTYINLPRLVAILAVTLIGNVGLAYAAGFKRNHSQEHSVVQRLLLAADQAIDATAVGIVASLIVLLVLNRISFTDPLDSILGKIVVQAMPLGLGASVANVVFARGESREGGGGGGGGGDGGKQSDGKGKQQDGQEGKSSQSSWYAFGNDVGATIMGGMFLGFSIAPTEEVPMLAAGLTLPHTLALIAATLLMSYGIVFASGFDPQQVSETKGPFQRPITETVFSYMFSLAVSAGAIFLFGHAELQDPLSKILTMMVVLGMPTAVGGAAGRLVI